MKVTKHALKKQVRESTHWVNILEGDKSPFMTPDWGPGLREITKDEKKLYLNELASPMPVGKVRGDYI